MSLAKRMILVFSLTLIWLTGEVSFAQSFDTTVKIVINQETILKLVSRKKDYLILEAELMASNPDMRTAMVSRRGSTILLEFVTADNKTVTLATDAGAFEPNLINRSNPLDREDITGWLQTDSQPEAGNFSLETVDGQPALVLNYHLKPAQTDRLMAGKLAATAGVGGPPAEMYVPPQSPAPATGQSTAPPTETTSPDPEKAKLPLPPVPGEKKPESLVTYITASSIIQNFKRGGIIMYFILACSIIGTYISLERFYVLQRRKVLPNSFIKEVSSALPKHTIDKTEVKEMVKNLLKICEDRNIPVARSLRNGLLVHFREGITGSKAAIVSSNDREGAFMEFGLGILGLLGNISPLLGLLGTVVGMISAFDMMAVSGSGKPEVVAAGISMALITTAGGLIVGIPLVLFFNLLQAKISHLLLDMEEFCMEVIERLIYEEE